LEEAGLYGQRLVEIMDALTVASLQLSNPTLIVTLDNK
jgi:hypothetical protein